MYKPTCFPQQHATFNQSPGFCRLASPSQTDHRNVPISTLCVCIQFVGPKLRRPLWDGSLKETKWKVKAVSAESQTSQDLTPIFFGWVAGWLGGWMAGCGWVWLGVAGCGWVWLAGCGRVWLGVGGWLAGWLGGWVAGWLGGWLAGWLAGWVEENGSSNQAMLLVGSPQRNPLKIPSFQTKQNLATSSNVARKFTPRSAPGAARKGRRGLEAA